MAENLDFTRSVNVNIKLAEDRIFDAILDFSRSDDGEVDFSGKTIKMDIYKHRESTPVYTLTSETEITILTNRLTFDIILDDLELRTYKYRLYNDTDKIAIAWGNIKIEWG